MVQAAPQTVDSIPDSACSTQRSAYADDPDMKEAIAEFVSGLPQRINEISALLGESKLGDLQRMIHQLKGAGGGYGFEQITRSAASAEKLLRDKCPLDLVKSEVDALIALVRSVQGYQLEKESAHA